MPIILVMKLLALLAITFFWNSETFAGFTKTTHDFGNYVPSRQDLTGTFEFKNPGPAPAILVHVKTESVGRCEITSYTKEPIKKNWLGKVNFRCRFTDEGFNSKRFATFQIKAGSSTSLESLSAKANVVNSSDCKPMDLNDEPTLRKMPVLDQDGMGICYAFAAAQMVEYQALKKGINRSFSAIDASFVSKKHLADNAFKLDSGLTDSTLTHILDDGIATRSCIDRVIKKYTQGTSLSSEEFLSLVEDVWTARRKKASDAQIKKDLKNQCTNYGISVDQFSDLLKDLDVPFKTYIAQMFNECESERVSMDELNLKVTKKVSGTNLEMVKAIDRLLDKKSPPNLVLCAEILQSKPKHRGLIINGSKRDFVMKNNERDCGTHGVLATGRRKINNRCEYLIRNSWGSTWAPKTLTCACKTPKAYYPDCSKNKETGGQKVMVGCWVKEEDLIANTKNVIGLE